jgi:hypothetical protein
MAKGHRILELSFAAAVLTSFASDASGKDLRSDDEFARAIVQESRQEY